MDNQVEYEKLRLDVLIKLIEERDIPYKKNKDEIIKLLKLDDQEKYIRDTIHEKTTNGFNVGIDLKNHTHLIQVGNLVFKKEAHSLNRYSDKRIWYWVNQKLM